MEQPPWVNLDIGEASEILGVTRRHLGRTIAPVMMVTGAAWQKGPGHPWRFDANEVSQWAKFLEDRHQFVVLGVWSPNRKYTAEDYYNWLDFLAK